MKRILLAAAVCSLTACAWMKKDHSTASEKVEHADRKISQSDSEENLQTTFETLLNSEDPEARFLAYLDRHNNLYFTAHNYLAAFDAKLKEQADAEAAGRPWDEVEALSPMRDPNYKKLLASRILQERFRDKISYLYVELLKLAAYVPSRDASAPGDQAEKSRKNKIATKVLSAYNKKLQALKKSEDVDKVAVQVLIDNSLDTIRRYNAERKKLRLVEPRLADGLPTDGIKERSAPQIFTTDRAMVSFLNRYKEDIARVSKEEELKILGEDKVELEDLAAMIETATDSREPQSAPAVAFKPDNGPIGNITGNTFPLGTWSITFDDGPSGKYTPQILQTALNNQVPLTFFWLAQNIAAYPEPVKSVYKGKMAIESHSYTHANLPKMSDDKLDYEITDATSYTTRTLDSLNSEFSMDPSVQQKLRFFRCPYGAGLKDQRIRSRITNKNLIHVFWNVDSLDWQDKNPDSIVQRVVTQMRTQRKGVVLFHDVHPQSAAAFEKLAKMIKDKPADISATPIRLTSIPTIVDEMNGAK